MTTGLELWYVYDCPSSPFVLPIILLLIPFLASAQKCPVLDSYLLGDAWNPKHVMKNITSAIALGTKVTVNFNVTSRNFSQIGRLLDASEKIGFDAHESPHFQMTP
jgi:hypothetical protein